MADSAHLVEPTLKYGQQIWDYRQEFVDCGEPLCGAGSLARCANSSDWLADVVAQKSIETLPKGLVTATQYICVRQSDQKIVGTIQIRHCLNEYLAKFGGHIGYSVAPSERHKGYATKMLKSALLRCRDLGLMRVLITCASDNDASRRTIIKCGGVYESTVFEPSQSLQLERYWITPSVGDSIRKSGANRFGI